MSGAPTARFAGPPEHLAQRIRAKGAVLDHTLIQTDYAPLLAKQSREGVSVERDAVYGPDERHRLDIYRPARAEPARAVVVFLHGGGFIRGDKQQRDNAGLRFARDGLLVLVPNYRLAPAHGWPAGAEDVVAVCGWLRQHRAGYVAAEAPVFLVGESAGAAHVALACLVCRMHPPGGLGIAGAVLISGVYNAQLEWLARPQFGIATPDIRNDAYFGSDPQCYSARSTVALIDAPAMPLLITYAEFDLLQMQVQAGELFAALVVKHGFRPELRVIPEHNHLTQVYAINTGDESLSGPVLDFIDRHTAVGANAA